MVLRFAGWISGEESGSAPECLTPGVFVQLPPPQPALSAAFPEASQGSQTLQFLLSTD
jgi:hypothetical protein